MAERKYDPIYNPDYSDPVNITQKAASGYPYETETTTATSAVKDAAMDVGKGLLSGSPLGIVLTFAGSFIQNMAAKRQSLQLTPEQQAYKNTVERYTRIAARRDAAASIASAFTGRPKSDFYGRKGFDERYSSEVVAGVQEKAKKDYDVASMKSKIADVGGSKKSWVKSKTEELKAKSLMSYGE